MRSLMAVSTAVIVTKVICLIIVMHARMYIFAIIVLQITFHLMFKIPSGI
jgi:hypothetical protein